MPRKALVARRPPGPAALRFPRGRQPLGQPEKDLFLRSQRQPGRGAPQPGAAGRPGTPPGEKIDLMNKLTELGDRYFLKKNDPLAEAFYRQTLKISPQDAWPVYNKLEKISRRRGGLLWNFAGVARQFALLTRSFNGSILLLDGFFSVLMFAGLLLFFMVAAALAVRYFKLAAHDFILEGTSRFSLHEAPAAPPPPVLAAAGHRRLGHLPLPALRLPLELPQPRRAGQRQAHPGPAAAAGVPLQPGPVPGKKHAEPGLSDRPAGLFRPAVPRQRLQRLRQRNEGHAGLRLLPPRPARHRHGRAAGDGERVRHHPEIQPAGGHPLRKGQHPPEHPVLPAIAEPGRPQPGDADELHRRPAEEQRPGPVPFLQQELPADQPDQGQGHRAAERTACPKKYCGSGC